MTWFYFLVDLGLVWASLKTGPALGRFRPVPLLLALFLVYNALPAVVVPAASALSETLLGGTRDIFVPSTMARISQLTCACVLGAYAGQFLAAIVHARHRAITLRVRATEEAPPLVPVDTTLVAALFLPLALAAFGLAWTLRGSLFTGYQDYLDQDTGKALLRGTMSSLFSLVFITYLLWWRVGDDWRARRRRKHAEFVLSSAIVLVIGGLLLSLGGRLYVASAAVTLIALRLAEGAPATGAAPVRPARTGRWRFLLAGVVLLSGASLIGVWRTQGALSGAAVYGNILAEPFYISISLVTLIDYNTLPVVAFPSFLLNDWVGLLPSFLYPNKLARAVAIFQAYDMQSPIGGLSGLATLLVNFGTIGTVVVFAGMGFVLTVLAGSIGRRDPTGTHRLIFVIATTFPLLSLQRDPPIIAVYKNLLQNALFWPYMLSLLLGVRVAQSPFGRRRRLLGGV